MADTNPALEQLQKSLQTFSTLQMASESRDKLYRYNDALMQSLYSILEDCDCDQSSKLETFNTTMEQYAAAMRELFPMLISGQVEKTDDAHPEENPISKSDPNRFDTIEEVEKFNPYHDSLGRFATSSGYSSFTIRTRDPGKQHWADNAIAREKERAAAAAAAEPPAKPKVVEFTPAKTKKEAVAYAQSQLGFTKASYGTKLDIDTINHINEQITKIQAEYPETKGACQVLKTTTSSVYAQIRTAADGTMNFEIGTPTYSRGMEYIKQGYARDVQAGFHPKGTDHSSIIWHEYGHVLAVVSAKQQYGATATGKIAATRGSQYQFISSRRSRATEKEWLLQAAKDTGSTAGSMARSISRYATRNAAETFAEAFAEYKCSANPSAEATAIVKASGWAR